MLNRRGGSYLLLTTERINQGLGTFTQGRKICRQQEIRQNSQQEEDATHDNDQPVAFRGATRLRHFGLLKLGLDNLLDRFFQNAIQRHHERCRINIDQTRIVADKTADKGIAGQAVPIAPLQRLNLTLTQLQALGHIAHFDPQRLARRGKLLADRHLRRRWDAFWHHRIDVNLLTHSKLPLRNSWYSGDVG